MNFSLGFRENERKKVQVIFVASVRRNKKSKVMVPALQFPEATEQEIYAF